MTKTFLMGALILGFMTSVGTGVLAQERRLDPTAPGKIEAFDKESLINQESPGAPARAVGEEASRLEQPAPGHMEATDESPAMHELGAAGTVSGEEKTPRHLKNIKTIENGIKRFCDMRKPKETTEAIDKACEAMGCDNSPYQNCGIE
ncbi:MAG: hypothetical protein KBD90_05120 [Alphaproteobacteria bacterium]|nr:hypothetical protein [Alphaproteobacteria bacterium]